MLHGQMLGSCEDIGGSVSGLELEELTSLEKKIKRLEKAETAAVEKVKLLETETQKLRENVDDIQKKLAKVWILLYLSLIPLLLLVSLMLL